jgi:MFS family permease
MQMDVIGRRPVRSIFYGWYIATAGLSSCALGYGARYSFSVIFLSLLDEFAWPRDVTASMLSVHILIYGALAPVAGYLVDQAGPRKTMVLGTVLLSSGLALSRWCSEPWHFYISFGLLSGTGLCLMGSVSFTTVIRNWFEQNRGLALALMGFGSGVSFTFYPAIALSIDHLGWRNTLLIEAFVLAGIMIPLILLIVRYHPMERGLMQDGLQQKAMKTSPGQAMKVIEIIDHTWASKAWTFSEAVRTRRFWLLAIAMFSLWGVMQHIMVAHHVAFAVDMGYTKIYASSVLSLFGILFGFGSLAGLISDRIGREVTLTLGTIIGISAIIALILIKDVRNPWLLYYYAVGLGIGIGLCVPTMIASITDIFQGPKVGFVIGCIWSAFAIGGALGPWLGGWLFELRRDYVLSFILAIALYVVGCGAVWLAAPRKVRRISRCLNSAPHISEA